MTSPLGWMASPAMEARFVASAALHFTRVTGMSSADVVVLCRCALPSPPCARSSAEMVTDMLPELAKNGSERSETPDMTKAHLVRCPAVHPVMATFGPAGEAPMPVIWKLGMGCVTETE